MFLAEIATGVPLGGSDSGWVYNHGALFGPAIGGNAFRPATRYAGHTSTGGC